MSAKRNVSVLIGGKVYTLSGYEEEEYLQKVATYINGKISEFEGMDGYRRFSADMKSTLMELNIADDYFKAKDQVEKYKNDLEEKEKEIYELKHGLITDQVKVEDLQAKVEQLERENRELKRLKEKLEASLEDALLGPADGIG